VTDSELSDDDELDSLEDLSEEELKDRFYAELCGLPLELCVEAMADPVERRDFVGTYGMVKIGTAAGEVLESEDLMGPEDRAELAIILLEVLTVAAKEAGAHRHKLASGLRALARTASS